MKTEPTTDALRVPHLIVRLLLRWICRKLVIQGPAHRANIIAYYRIMREAAEQEFSEDNKPTLDAFLRECHDEANASDQLPRP